MSLSEIESLSSREREEFAHCAALLTSKTFILRQTPENTPSKEFGFIIRKFGLFEEYLGLSCWKIYYDKQLGVIYVKNTEGYNKVTLNKLATQVLITLRLIYEEKRMTGGIKDIVPVTVGELYEKMINELSVLSKKPVQKDLKEALRTLELHNIIYKMDYSYDELECCIKILPSILIAVPNERCKAVYESIRAETKEEEDEASDEITDD